LKRKAKEQAHEQLKEEEWLKLETAKAKLNKKEARDKFYMLQKQLDQKHTEQGNSLKAAEDLLVDAEKRLSEAIKTGDMCQVSVASGLLEVGRKRVAAANMELTSIADNRKKMKNDDDIWLWQINCQPNFWTLVYVSAVNVWLFYHAVT